MSSIAAAVRGLPPSLAEVAPSGAEAVLRLLGNLGVRHVFGIPGGAVSPYLKLLRRSATIELVIGSHEGAARSWPMATRA